MKTTTKPLPKCSDEESDGLKRDLIDPAVQFLLAKKSGPLFSEDDAVDVAVDALYEAFEKFDPSKGRIDDFYWTIVRSRSIDRIRKNRRQRNRFESHRESLIKYHAAIASPEPASLEDEEEDKRARAALGNAMDQLTPRMRTAVEGRWLLWDGDHWAEDLTKTEGHTAQYWRKASDDGAKRLATLLAAAGFEIQMKGANSDATPSTA